MDNFPKTIKKLRDSKNITQKELANLLGMKTYTTITKWESGENFPKGKDIKKLSEIFSVSSDYILGLTNETGSKITKITSQLEEPRQKIVLDTASSQLKEQTAVKREKQILPFKKMQLEKINNIVAYDHNQEGMAPIIGEIAAGTPIFSEQNFEGMRPVYGKYAGRDDVFWLHVKGDSMESEIHDGSFALIMLSPDIDDGAIGAVRFTEDNSATLKCVHYEYDEAGYVKRIRLEPLNPKYPIQYADESNPAEIAGRLVKVEQDY